MKSIYDIIPSTYEFYRQKDDGEQTRSEWFMNEMIGLLNVLAEAWSYVSTSYLQKSPDDDLNIVRTIKN